MKIKYMLGIVALVFVIMSAIILAGVCNMAGGISQNSVERELSRYIDGDDAKVIVQRQRPVDTNLLVAVSLKNLSSAAMTILLLHPSFPQWRRSELIKDGRDGFYLDNACLLDTLTDEDVKQWVRRTSISESVLESALNCKSLSEESKNAIRQRIQNSVAYRLRRLFGSDKND